MAFRLNIDAKFRPFTFQEMLAPLAADTQAHQALEQQYAELDAKAGEWERLALNEKDKDVYEQYKAYANKLRAASDNLYNKGLDLNSRKEFFNLNTAYNREILPIAEAWNERRRQILAQQEMMAKDPTHMFRYNASDIGLNEFLKNPNYDTLSENYSGALLTNQVHIMASDLKQAILESRKDSSKLRSLGIPFKYEKQLIKGATPEEVLAAMRMDPDALPVLLKLASTAVNASGIPTWNNKEMFNRAMDYALQGLTGAIGTTEYKDYSDDYGMQLSLAATKRAWAKQDAAEAAAAQNDFGNSVVRPISEVDASGASVGVKGREDLNFVNEVKKTRLQNLFKKSREGNYNNIAQLNILGRKYGVGTIAIRNKDGRISASNKRLNKLKSLIEESINKSVVLNTGYALHNTDIGYTTMPTLENLRIYGKKAPAYKVDDNGNINTNKRISKEELDNMKEFSSMYVKFDNKGRARTYMTYADKDGKTKTIAVDATALDGSGQYGQYLKEAEAYYGNKNYNAASLALHNALNLYYGYNNQRGQTQSKTTSYQIAPSVYTKEQMDYMQSILGE